mmetsp:Transcript_15666/g.61202  ORF Transcript_15666/g.61202 Transcript_15666/m.61202 type:complete len:249 (-) Transcript_15666:140-886(-)
MGGRRRPRGRQEGAAAGGRPGGQVQGQVPEVGRGPLQERTPLRPPWLRQDATSARDCEPDQRQLHLGQVPRPGDERQEGPGARRAGERNQAGEGNAAVHRLPGGVRVHCPRAWRRRRGQRRNDQPPGHHARRHHCGLGVCLCVRGHQPARHDRAGLAAARPLRPADLHPHAGRGGPLRHPEGRAPPRRPRPRHRPALHGRPHARLLGRRPEGDLPAVLQVRHTRKHRAQERDGGHAPARGGRHVLRAR